MINFLRSIRDREEGQTLTEYALILSLVSVASIAFLTPLSDAINGVFTSVTGALKSKGLRPWISVAAPPNSFSPVRRGGTESKSTLQIHHQQQAS